MSEKIPISLRNSDLFLKLKLADGNKEEKDVENGKPLISKKGPSLGENNHLKSLHAFSLLTPLQTFSYFNKTVNSSPYSSSFLKSSVKKPTFEKTTNLTDKNQDDSQYTQDRELKYKSTEVRDTYPVRYKLQTKLSSISFELNDLPEQESKAGLREQHQRQAGLQGAPSSAPAKTPFLHGADSFVQLSPPFDTTLNQTKSLSEHRSDQLGVEVVCTSKAEQNGYSSLPLQTKRKVSSVQSFLKVDFYSPYLQSFLDKINREICSGISQKFSIVAINLILFSVLTIVQRSHYGKSSSAINQKDFRTILYTSKLPNLTMWYGMPRDVRQPRMFKNEAGLFANGQVSWWHAKPKQMVGSFIKQLDISPCVNNGFRDTTEEHTSKGGANKAKLSYASGRAKAFVKKGYVSKVYYCIKASNVWNNQITATRSIKQEASNTISYEQQIVPKFQYIPYNTNQHRTFTENDSIPEKRDSISSKIVTQQHKNKLKSSRLTSELLLKRCFYKYGFFLIQFSELNQRTHPNSAVQSEKEGNFFGRKTVALMSQENQVKSFDNKTLAPPLAKASLMQKHSFCKSEAFARTHSSTCLEKELVLKGLQRNNQINGSTLNNYINLGLYRKKTIPFLETGNNKSSATFKSSLPESVYNKKASSTSSMPTELCSKKQTGACKDEPKNTKPGLRAKQSFAFLRVHKRSFCITKFCIPSLLQNAQTWFAQGAGLLTNGGSKACVFPGFFSSGLTWSKYNLEKARIVDFVQVKNAVLTFHFKPDTLVQNTSVSGYQFTELQRKQIATLLREISIFDTPINQNIYLHSQAPANNLIFKKQQQISNKVPPLAPCVRAKAMQKHNFAFVTPDSFSNPGLSNVDLNFLSKRSVDLKMQYTQTNLDEIESVKKLFKELGRDYEDYMRQPKDSLPALIISPSLEDDREIEEEGIRIFRKRNLLKKKNLKGTIPSNNKDQTFIDNVVAVESQDNERQNHESLVKNALRQAQEEIDDIAKKEEKSGDKEKQVIPPLTRLEALYTIRQREKRCEQAKDLKREKGHAQAKLTFTKKSYPLFEELFLYSDKLNTNSLSGFQFIDIRTAQLLSRLGDERSNKTIQNTTLLSRVNALPKFAQSTDRKHSFFGEMSLPAHKLTAQKQKQVFEQKGDPLVKLNAKNTELVNDKLNRRAPLNVQAEKLFASGGPFDTQTKPSFVSFHSTVATLPFSLLSPLSISSKTHNKKLESSRFQVGIVKTNITAPLAWGFENGRTSRPSLYKTSSHIQPAGPKTKSLLKPSLSKKTDQEVKLDQFDWVRGPNRIYFYDNLSQNKACQGSTPKIKATPLGSPVYHRVWQPKRMEPSSFRVLQRSTYTPVLPKISQNDWKNIMEWQLKKHFFEEDKRVRPLDNTNKRFKIKKVNLYLPWISITKTPDNNVFAETEAYKNEVLRAKAQLLHKLCYAKPKFNLIFVDRKSNGLVNQLRLPENNIATTSFIKNNNVEKNQNFVVSLQNNLTKSLPGRYNAEIESPLLSRKEEFLNTNIQRNCQTTCYWRLPTRQNLFSSNIPSKTETHGSKQSRPKVIPSGGIQNEVMQKQSFVLHGSVLLKPTQSFIQTVLGKKNSLALQSENSKQNQARPKNYVFTSPQSQKGVVQKVFKESFLFESATGYSWLFIYAFVSVLMFKQLFKWVYQAGLKDFFIKFLNSDFGRNITSEEFRYSIQNVPLKELYTPNKRLQELFSLDKNKVQLLEVVWFLRNNCQGRYGPRGVLLVGPPGVENISVVQAIAGEAKVPIFVQSLEKIAQDNEPQRQLEQLYMRAHKHAPCVLFLDQLDTIGSRRDQLFTEKARASSLDYKAKVDLTSPDTWAQQAGARKNDVFATGGLLNKLPDTNFSQKKENPTIFKSKLNVLLRLLTILDGITQSSGVVTVATARDITKLDPALLRPKRFDRRIYLSLPNRQDRVQLFKIQTQNIGHIKEMPWDYLSLRTENMSAADIQSAINYSLFRAVLKKSVHTVETLEYGIDCVKTLTEKRVTVM